MGANNSTQNFGKTSVYKVESSDTENNLSAPLINVRDGYYKNKKGVFYGGVSLKLSKRELSSFEKLKYGYAKTDIHVFYKGNIIEGADPKTFETINRKQMPDQYKKYKLNSAIGVDMDFEKKKKRIYQFGIKIFEL